MFVALAHDSQGLPTYRQEQQVTRSERIKNPFGSAGASKAGTR